MELKGEIIVAGSPEGAVTGPALVYDLPLSFWGGVSAEDGRLLDRGSIHHGRAMAGQILFIGTLKGSSSTSSVLLELIHRGLAPAAIVVDAVDAILVLGILVGREMGWASPSILRLAAADQARVRDRAMVTVAPDGAIRVEGGAA